MIQNSDHTGNYDTTPREGISLKLTPQPRKPGKRLKTELRFGFHYWATPSLFPICLLPVTRHPHPAAAPGHPLAFDPHSCRPWTHYPTARHPDIGGSSPSPITP